ncbi:MAG: porin family protein [Flavobacteriales bacterium]
MRTLVVTLTACILCTSLLSQTDQAIDQDFDPKAQFGFNLGVNYTHLLTDGLPSDADVNNDFGVRIGILTEFPVHKYVSLSPKAELSFHGSSIDMPIVDVFSPEQTPIGNYKVAPVFLEIMNHFVIKNNTKASSTYFLIGPNLKIPIQSANKNHLSFNEKLDFAVDFGIGFDKSLTHFRFAPEIRYSFGLMNLNEATNIESVHLHNISLLFNFKG